MGLTQKTGIKEVARANDVAISQDFYEAFESHCGEELAKALVRCKANSRKTLAAKDL